MAGCGSGRCCPGASRGPWLTWNGAGRLVKSSLKGSLKGDRDAGIDTNVDMDLDSDMAVSIHWAAPFAGFGVDIRQVKS